MAIRSTITYESPMGATERCDRCGAQAFVKAEVNNLDLLFCAHHWSEHEAKIREVAATIHDHTPSLRPKAIQPV